MSGNVMAALLPSLEMSCTVLQGSTEIIPTGRGGTIVASEVSHIPESREVPPCVDAIPCVSLFVLPRKAQDQSFWTD